MYHSGIISEKERRERLAERVRKLRDAQVMTQEDLASVSKVGRATVARIEAATVDARASTIRKLAGALGVKPVELIDDRPLELW